MTRLSPITCAVLCLPLSACVTPAAKPPTLPSTVAVQPGQCPLTPCRLPGRPAIATTDDWRLALDATEDALLACAAQVLDCMERQRVGH